LPSTLRVYRPRATVAFGKLDRLSPGYEAAVAAARDHGYEPVLRLPGGHAAAYHADSIGIDVVWALDDPATGTHDRFAIEGERLAGALQSLGVDARVGEVPGEYCPGAYSVNARGRVKLIGTAQRLVRGAALLGASVVVGDGASIRAVLRDVYSGRGTEAAHSPEFDIAPTTSIELDGPDPLHAFGLGETAGLPEEGRRS
jgi:lipoate-protein ligase A